MQSSNQRIVVLGTGGTIAGRSASAGDNVGYVAGEIGVEQLVGAVPPLAGQLLEAEQVAQLDSKDMDHATWLRLAQRVAFHIARRDVQGVVITHGTDTLEETAFFLQRVLGPAKPVVMTAAMRPATALLADGPQNLVDAVTLARESGVRGVVAVLNGQVFGAEDLRKLHSYRLDAFGAGDAGPLAVLEEGRLRRFREWPAGRPLGLAWLPSDPARWPRVEVLLSHAGASGALVEALAAQGVRGIVVAGTGNGTVHHEMLAALHRAQALRGVAVWRASRCAHGAVVGSAQGQGGLVSAGALGPVKARIELMLQLMAPSPA